MKHVVQIEVTINSHADADERLLKAASMQGMPPPYGPVVCQKIAKFGSEGTSFPEATQAAVEALVAYCNSDGVTVIPGAPVVNRILGMAPRRE